MRHITIKIKHGNIAAHDEKTSGARREWTVNSQLEIYLLGGFNPLQYRAAARLALDICEEMKIPASQLVTVQKGKAARGLKVSDKQTRMF